MTAAPARQREGRESGPVLVVDDHDLFSQILCRALEAEGIEARVGFAPTAEAILSLAAASSPRLVLLDLDLGGGDCDGAALIEPLQAMGAPVVVLTASKDELRRAECIAAGACTVLRKDAPFGQLLTAIGSVEAGEELLSPQERQRAVHRFRTFRERETTTRAAYERLTARERHVLRELSTGARPNAIAEESFVSISTVRSQIRSILTKLGVSSQLAAVAMARDAGWF